MIEPSALTRKSVEIGSMIDPSSVGRYSFGSVIICHDEDEIGRDPHRFG